MRRRIGRVKRQVPTIGTDATFATPVAQPSTKELRSADAAQELKDKAAAKRERRQKKLEKAGLRPVPEKDDA